MHDLSRGWRARLALACALAAVVVLPLLPGVLASGSVMDLVRVPVEPIVVLLLLALSPWRGLRVAFAVCFGLLVALAVLLAAIDRGYEVALGIHFVPLDWLQLADAYGVVASAIGAVPASAIFTVAGAAIVTVGGVAGWAALRVDAALRRRADNGRGALAIVAVAWIAIAAVAAPLRVADPVAAAASTGSIGSAVSRAVSALQTRAQVAREVARDQFADVPAADLLAGLAGKDVIVVFVESYGRIALEGAGISPGVNDVLRRGEDTLSTHGYTARSAWLTSPTFGGVSWLAHATLQTGVWIDSQAVYDLVVRTDRLTLSAAFARAGWRTVSDVPSNQHPWDVGSSFYRYDTLLDATNVGYRGPSFGYARIPDQYTLKHFADNELAGAAGPVMAEIDLVSSHTPWAPLPELVPWSDVGDGSIYDAQPARSRDAGDVWSEPETVRQFYGRSVEYSLGSMLSFLENVDDPDLVVVMLGDHQPAAIVSGDDAGHDVPISVIARDPAVFDAIADWGWSTGLRPSDGAPVWRMDDFRDRLFEAFGTTR